MKADTSGLRNLAKRLGDPSLQGDLNKIVQQKGIAALVGQAVADNFAKEGPGWAPLKAETIRRSVSKRIRKAIAHLTDKQLLRAERKLKASPVGEGHRRILDRTGLLKKTATIPGYSGTSKSGLSGSNIMRVEGTNLVWGSDLVYAGVHNKGDPSKGIPKREYLVIREEWRRQIYEFAMKRMLMLIRDKLRSR